MTKYLTLILIIALVVSCFHIDQVSCISKKGRRIGYSKRRTLRFNRRMTPPDADAALSTAKVGLMGILAATEHTLLGETKFMDAQPAAVAAPASVKSSSTSGGDDSWSSPNAAAAQANEGEKSKKKVAKRALPPLLLKKNK